MMHGEAAPEAKTRWSHLAMPDTVDNDYYGIETIWPISR
ncbi:hypothetical protein [Azospirillum palustre]